MGRGGLRRPYIRDVGALFCFRAPGMVRPHAGLDAYAMMHSSLPHVET